jgi:putative DNA primase/helicase
MQSHSSMSAEDIAKRLGLKRYPRSWRGRCPACDYASTFTIRAGREGRALLFCASCRDRDALARAVALVSGQDHRCVPRPDPDEAARRQRSQDRALALWSGSESLLGTPAEIYLAGRGLNALAPSPALRFRPDTPHPEGGRYPALMALTQNSAGAPIAIHRTFLMRDGRKANVEPVKASLGPTSGGAIRLQAMEPDKPLVIGEGIETSASAGLLLGLPAWAAISAGNLAKGLELPPEVRRIVVAADPDEPGRNAARDAWRRWTAEERRVRIALPDGDRDFNELLQGRETCND